MLKTLSHSWQNKFVGYSIPLRDHVIVPETLARFHVTWEADRKAEEEITVVVFALSWMGRKRSLLFILEIIYRIYLNSCSTPSYKDISERRGWRHKEDMIHNPRVTLENPLCYNDGEITSWDLIYSLSISYMHLIIVDCAKSSVQKKIFFLKGTVPFICSWVSWAHS